MNNLILAVLLLAVLLLAGWSRELRLSDPARLEDQVVRVVESQSATLRSMAPLLGLWTLCGFLAGAALRDRVRDGDGYSSPTAAWIAKKILIVAAVILAAHALGGLRLEAGWLYGAGLLHAAGWAAYVRNLPARL